MREATFNALGSLGVVEGAAVLDLFAGSGAMGIEALSRGASQRDLRRPRPGARVEAIRTNLRRHQARRRGDRGRAATSRGSSPTQATAFDLAVLDPPYAFDGWDGLAVALLPVPVVVIESDREIDPGAGWAVVRSRRYGSTVVTISRSRRADHEETLAVTTVLYPGSFDPFHNGHRELVETAAYLFDDVVVAAMRNPQKGEPLFSLDERQAMIEESLAHLDNIERGPVREARRRRGQGRRRRLHHQGPAGRRPTSRARWPRRR